MNIPTLPAWPGWNLIYASPDDGVGSWLLHRGGAAVLLEVPPGLETAVVRAGLEELGGAHLGLVTASHRHEDHLDVAAWRALKLTFPAARFVNPGAVQDFETFDVGGEPLYLIHCPKHSWTDVVTVFRGVAMTGDLELGTLASVNDEVPPEIRRESFARLRSWPARVGGYRVHAVVSAHLNDVRQGVDWPALFPDA